MTAMPAFHLVLFAGSSTAQTQPLSVTFDYAYSRLTTMEGILIEPDGSFTWNYSHKDRVEGQLFDQGDFLNCVELRGNCDLRRLPALLAAFGWPTANLYVQCNTTGLVVPVDRFLEAGERASNDPG